MPQRRTRSGSARAHAVARPARRRGRTIIAKLAAAVASYPDADTYRAWPGPNSNTFLAHLGREIPELRLTLPPTAIGKDYLPDGRIFARTPSGTGYQASIAGLLGLIAGGDEGFELNVLGLVTGFDLARPALKLPGIGRVPARRLSARRLWRAGVRWPPAKPVTRNLRFRLYSLPAFIR